MLEDNICTVVLDLSSEVTKKRSRVGEKVEKIVKLPWLSSITTSTDGGVTWHKGLIKRDVYLVKADSSRYLVDGEEQNVIISSVVGGVRYYGNDLYSPKELGEEK